MHIRLANEIMACLPKERTLYHYHDDRYAIMLLERLIGEGMAIADIKSSRFAKLLDRPLVRDIVARKGDGRLNAGDLSAVFANNQETYVLTAGLWGWKNERSWCQTSRPGANLVLQMNFSGEHDAAYRKLVDPQGHEPYAAYCHPICTKGRNTLAWARIDMDFGSGEALIEEIQNDWLRNAARGARYARTVIYDHDAERASAGFRQARGVAPEDVIRYYDDILRPHRLNWSDAMLGAALWFLWNEIGLRRIWFHDHATGSRLKKIAWNLPPRSIYTDLPKRFCFERTADAPAFLLPEQQKKMKHRLKRGQERFWRLDL
jgi:hypothetical protein